jgi:stage III sporulation protein SpoIIIAA
MNLGHAFKCMLTMCFPACSNEIGGEGAVPHPCIGSSRRVVVPRRELQHEKLLEAVQNMNPDVVICDEISDRKVGALERLCM